MKDNNLDYDNWKNTWVLVSESFTTNRITMSDAKIISDLRESLSVAFESKQRVISLNFDIPRAAKDTLERHGYDVSRQGNNTLIVDTKK